MSMWSLHLSLACKIFYFDNKEIRRCVMEMYPSCQTPHVIPNRFHFLCNVPVCTPVYTKSLKNHAICVSCCLLELVIACEWTHFLWPPGFLCCFHWEMHDVIAKAPGALATYFTQLSQKIVNQPGARSLLILTRFVLSPTQSSILLS